FKNILFFVDRMVEHSIGEFGRGTRVEPLHYNGVSLGMTICYENIFPHLVRRRVLAGADVIVNLTNDAWFGDSAAAEQHFSASVFRAVECRRPVIRCANTGISGAVDSKGHILKRTALFREAVFAVTVKTQDKRSPYLVFGDIFPWICGSLLITIIIVSVVKQRIYKAKGDQ
ncbi:apolipoprotein N-acyltransferase, partial [bacterium]|nr:apolipoprotein N-acyltransferase [candidate division CSSED10-310 bacterium]